MWRVRVSPEATGERAQAMKLLSSGAAQSLAASDQAYLQAMTSDSRKEAISVLQRLLQKWPRHTAGRKLLVGCLLFEGRHDELHTQAGVLRVLQPGDPETEIAVALAFAMQAEPEALAKQLARLEQLIPGEELKQLTVVINDLSNALTVIQEWDSGSVRLMDLLRNAVRFAGVLQSFTDATSVLNSTTGSLSTGLLIGRERVVQQPEERLRIRFAARLVAVAAGIATDNYGPFRIMVEELQAISPIRNDAFFPFVKGLTWFASGDWDVAVREFELADESPCIFRSLKPEIAYCLALSWAAWHTQPADSQTPVDSNVSERLEKAAAAAQRWEALAKDIRQGRVEALLPGLQAAGRFEQALSLIDRAATAQPGSPHTWDLLRLQVLDSARRDLDVIRLAETLSSAESLTTEEQQTVRRYREIATGRLAAAVNESQAVLSSPESTER